MKKILHIPNYYNPHIGGIEQAAEDVVDSLVGEEYINKVICFKDAKKTSYDSVNGVDVIRVSCAFKFRSQSIAPSYKKELKKVFNDYNPDIVIFHYPNPFVASCLLKVMKKYPNAKLVLFWHTDIVKQKFLRLFFNGQNKRLLNKAEVVLATSPNYLDGSEWLKKYKEKVKVLPLCVSTHFVGDTIEIEKRIKERNAGKNIIFALGRHVEYKGFKYLIEASNYLPDNYVIYLAGSGPLTPELQKQAGDNFKLIFTGRLSNEELEAYYKCSDVFAFPSITKNEAFGLALAEAMLHGLPAVTFTIPGSGVNFVNINNETGIEVENGNSKAYAEAIMKIVNNTELKNTFSINAKNRAINVFSKEKFKLNIIDIISKL